MRWSPPKIVVLQDGSVFIDMNGAVVSAFVRGVHGRIICFWKKEAMGILWSIFHFLRDQCHYPASPCFCMHGGEAVRHGRYVRHCKFYRISFRPIFRPETPRDTPVFTSEIEIMCIWLSHAVVVFIRKIFEFLPWPNELWRLWAFLTEFSTPRWLL